MKDYQEIVEKILKEHPVTRDDDNKLFVWVCSELKPDVMGKPFGKVMFYAHDLGLPSFETIRRTRQKLQEKKTSLRGEKYEARQAKQSDYIKTYGRKYT